MIKATHRPDRRTAIKWMMTAAAALAVLEHDRPTWAAAPDGINTIGYGMDPDLLRIYHPGDLWPLTFTDRQRRAATALCDVIIPADDRSPKASDVGVPDFIDEWISSPYPEQRGDRHVILTGLDWLDAEGQRRHGRDFADFAPDQQVSLCGDICDPDKASPTLKPAVRFFKRFRDLAAGGYYTTPVGMRDIGYVGNVPLASFEGPTPDALRHIGLA